MSIKESPSGGVKAFSITGRLLRRRERLTSLTDDERRWRAQWLKDQIISAEEPKYVPEYYRSTNNIFRRIWQFPAQQFEAILTPALGKNGAYFARLLTSTTIKFISTIYIVGYVMKYHSNDFCIHRSLELWFTRGRMYPDEPNFPDFPPKTPEDYCDLGFYSSVLCVDATPPEPPPPPLPPADIPSDFTRYRSWEIHAPRGRIWPDEPDYPNFVRKTPQQYLDHGFYSSPLAKQV